MQGDNLDAYGNTPVVRQKAVIKAHKGAITGISTALADDRGNAFITSARDKQLIVWNLTDDERVAVPVKSFTGHAQAISDCVMSNDGNFALTSSWDKTLRLWDLKHGSWAQKFVGHTSDVFSCAFSPDNRQIVSGSRDKTIKLWNALAECKYTVEKDQHTDWVSCVRFCPTDTAPLIVSCGWDKLAKVWDLPNCKMNYDLVGHKEALHTLAISPDGSLCASGGKDGLAMLWDAKDGRYLTNLDAGHSINSLCFASCNYWLCAGTDKDVKIWSLERKTRLLQELAPPQEYKSLLPWCTSLQWNKAGDILFAGTSSGDLIVYETLPSAF